MDPTYIVGLAQTLSTLIASDKTRYATDSINAFKGRKDKDAIIEKYEEVFTSLISENQELKRIALAYQNEYEKMNITDIDIEYLRNTFNRILDLLVNIGEEDKEQKEKIEQFSSLIDVDTLKTMQLLGFNYKQAIGEPLTLIVSDFIRRVYSNNIIPSNETFDETE